MSLFLLYSIYLLQLNSIKNEFQADVKPIENFIDSAITNIEFAPLILGKDPTLALQLCHEAWSFLDSARQKDTFRDKSYRFISKYKKNEYFKIDSIYCSKHSLIKANAINILDQNYAFYNIDEPENPDNLTDSIINKFAVNRIFPARTTASLFKVWNAEKHIIDTIKSHGQLSQVVFPSDSNRAMVLYKNGSAGYFDSDGDYHQVQNNESQITSIAPVWYLRSGYTMLSARNNNTIVEWNLNGTIRNNRVWDNIAQKSIIKPAIYYMKGKDLDDRVVSIAMSLGRTKIFTATDKGIGIIWKADTINVVLDSAKTKFDLGQDTVICSAFSNEGKMIVTGSKDNTVKIWNAENGYFIKELKGHTGSVTSLAFSANDRIVYTGSLDRTYKQWHLPATDTISRMSTMQWNKLETAFMKKITDTEPFDSR